MKRNREFGVYFAPVMGGKRDSVNMFETDDLHAATVRYKDILKEYPKLKSFDWAKDGLSFFDKAWSDCYRLILCQWTYEWVDDDIDFVSEEVVKCKVLRESDVLYIPEF